jgi:hypothetical protein
MRRSHALCFLALSLWWAPAGADPAITRDSVLALIEAVDAAAVDRDTGGIGRCLSEDFRKAIDIPDDEVRATVQIGNQAYLDMIARGWRTIDDYSYRRSDLVISIAADGLSAASFSTVTERLVVDGREALSRVREYARYRLENGRPLITTIESHTLVGDTTDSLSDAP